MTATEFVRRAGNPFERLFAALTDSRRCERTVALLLAGYAAVWALYGALAKASQDIHPDMAELVVWSRAPALGYDKHPPLAAWLVRAWFALFPLADWSYYLLAALVAALALWLAWRLSADYLSAEKRVLALALLTLVPFFNFHALKFNINTVLPPLWAATTLAFLRSYERRSVLWAALAGAAAAASMLGKYWSIFLLLGLAGAALLDSRRSLYFRSPAPWVTVLVGAIAIAPHLVWLFEHDFAPFSYAAAVHGTGTRMADAASALTYLVGGAAYVAVPVAMALLAARPDPTTLADMLWPAAGPRRLAALAFWGPLLLPALVAPLTGVSITSLWTMSAWTLLGVVLLSPPGMIVPRREAVRVLTFACVFPFVMVAVAPAIAIVIHRRGVAPEAAHASLLAGPVARLWNEASNQPLRIVGGDLAYGLAFYLPSAPLPFPSTVPPPWIEAGSLARDGLAIACNVESSACVVWAESLAGASARRAEITLARNFAGTDGPAGRYLILAIPPRHSADQ